MFHLKTIGISILLKGFNEVKWFAGKLQLTRAFPLIIHMHHIQHDMQFSRSLQRFRKRKNEATELARKCPKTQR